MRRQRPVLLVAGAVACLAACGTDPVQIASPDLTDADAGACEALVAALPDRVGDQERREVDGRYGAAYGDPAILVLCGVPRPNELMTDCMSVDGVDWYFDETDAGTRAITAGTIPRIEVQIPADYGTSAAALVDIAAVVEATTQTRRGC